MGWDDIDKDFGTKSKKEFANFKGIKDKNWFTKSDLIFSSSREASYRFHRRTGHLLGKAETFKFNKVAELLFLFANYNRILDRT